MQCRNKAKPSAMQKLRGDMQKSKGKPGDSGTTAAAQKNGMPSMFVIARMIVAKRRATKNIEKKYTLVKGSPKRCLKLPIDPLGRGASPRLLKPTAPSPPGSTNSGKSSAKSKSPLMQRVVHANRTHKCSAQNTPMSKSSPKSSSSRSVRKSNSSSFQKIDREAFRCARSGNIRSAYLWDDDEDELGRGGCGVVFVARARDNPARQVAVKRVLTSSLTDMQALQKEVEVLRKLDHPNVLRLYESFEDGKTMYLVVELCKGGDLFERISDSEHCSEKYCSQVSAQVCGALAHCHDQGICHRDLKPENLLLLSHAEDAPVKVADFGLAKHYSQRVPSQNSLVEKCRQKHKAIRRLKTFAGTLEYMAPEVIRIKDENSGPDTYYDFRCDTWAFGVIAYMMLKGNWPFKLEQVAAYVAEGVPLPDVEASDLSSMAKDFISVCLRGDFKKRPYPADLLKHPFLEIPKTKELSVISPMGRQFRRFAGLSGIKKAALTAAVRHLKGFEIEELRTHFELFDVNRDGTVTLEEFKKALAQWPKLLPKEFDSGEELFRALDSDGSGQISYTEFLAASMDVHLEDRDDLARAAFDAFDQTAAGEITSMDIQRIMGGQRQKTRDLEEIGIMKGEGASFESFREHLRL
eukprot:gnl/MRDRNA2_/MRDRNA2_124708_c0_seq1.p1 gnl/MRDRNA2_/MRDRNA2_124708_c0~~gnl/MRDRNA2_/MRDRNA2_124708_c0_seq1.p1  ORF type:complete len:635 (+),score=141.77 gnl/MRDRNA2_/MRDRNA2_124708_c0_seq1:92-1996(+)